MKHFSGLYQKAVLGGELGGFSKYLCRNWGNLSTLPRCVSMNRVIFRWYSSGVAVTSLARVTLMLVFTDNQYSRCSLFCKHKILFWFPFSQERSCIIMRLGAGIKSNEGRKRTGEVISTSKYFFCIFINIFFENLRSTDDGVKTSTLNFTEFALES